MIDNFFREKRKYPRIELNLVAKYKVLDDEQLSKYTKTQNISAEGVCFESDELLKPGIYVQLEVDIQDNFPPISMVAEIKWAGDIAPNKGKKYINGVKIISIPAKDEVRFLKYYCDRIIEKLSAYLK